MSAQNPFLSDWTREFEMPPFELINDEHYADAFDAAFAETRAAVAAIVDDSQPTFENTIEALERSDTLMDKVAGVFANLTGSNSNETLEALQRDLSPKFAALNSEIMMNEALFARIETLYETRAELNLIDEQARVLELYFKRFVRSGAKLRGADRDRLKDVLQTLAKLGTQFMQNLLADERTWFMELSREDMDGCPQFLIDAAAQAATDRDIDGYVITLSRSLIVPFLQFSPRRDLRQKAFEAWGKRGANAGETDNRDIVRETLELRKERANLLGFDTFSDFKLEPEMAGTPDKVRDLLMAVWEPAKAAADADATVLGEMMVADGIDADLAPWDWRYYAEKTPRGGT